ncbi:MAG TPA: nuclear transport factor 2 family protein [Solirubrobacteraceae bacterium]|nr:nuclear transport factor 2 family protein [Solirubrobacteraceae bacterium]
MGVDVFALTRSAYSALGSGHFDALLDMFGPAAVWDMSRWGLGVHAGLAAIARFLEDWFGALEHYELPVEEMRDLDEDTVFAISELVSRGVGGGGLLRIRSAWVFEWAGVHIVRVTGYPDIDEGRAAAGALVASRAQAP